MQCGKTKNKRLLYIQSVNNWHIILNTLDVMLLSTQKPWNPKSQKWQLNKFHYKTACFSLSLEADCVRFWPNRSGLEASRRARIIGPTSGQCFQANPDQMRHVYWVSVLPAANHPKLFPLCPLSNLLLSVELLSRHSHMPSQPGTCGNDVQKSRIQYRQCCTMAYFTCY